MYSVINNPPTEYVLIMWSSANWATRSVLLPKKEFVSVRGVEYEAMKRDLPKRLYQTILESNDEGSRILKTEYSDFIDYLEMVDGSSRRVRNVDRPWFDRSRWCNQMQHGFDHIKNFRATKKQYKKHRKNITDAFLILERRVFFEDFIYDLQVRRAKRIILDWWLRKRHYLKSKRTYYVRNEIESKPGLGIKFFDYEDYVNSVANMEWYTN